MWNLTLGFIAERNFVIFPLIISPHAAEIFWYHLALRSCVYSVAKSCPTVWEPMTLAGQAPLSMGYSREEYWSVLPFRSPGDLTDPRVETRSLASHAMASRFFTTEQDGKPRLSVVSAVKNLVRLLSRQRQQQKIFVFPNDKLFQFTGIYIIKNCILKPESL